MAKASGWNSSSMQIGSSRLFYPSERIDGKEVHAFQSRIAKVWEELRKQQRTHRIFRREVQSIRSKKM